MNRLIKKVFIVLLSFSGSLATKCIALNNQTCFTRPTLIDLNSDENNQGLHRYPFIVNLDRRNGSCNTHDDLLIRIFVPNKAEYVKLNVFNMITTKIKKKHL